MARKFVDPVPEDRSINAPTHIVSGNQVLGLYNQNNDKANRRERVNDTVKSWFIQRMKSLGWSEVTFSGNQAILKANLELKKPKNDRADIMN